MSKILTTARWVMRGGSAARSVAGRAATKLKATVAHDAVRVSVDGVSADVTVQFDPEPMTANLAERMTLEAQIDAAARHGHVPDALMLCYFANLQDELDEDKRRLTQTEHRLEASLRQLSARCPEPPAPEPAPPPPRRRSYRPIGDWFPRDRSGLPH